MRRWVTLVSVGALSLLAACGDDTVDDLEAFLRTKADSAQSRLFPERQGAKLKSVVECAKIGEDKRFVCAVRYSSGQDTVTSFTLEATGEAGKFRITSCRDLGSPPDVNCLQDFSR